MQPATLDVRPLAHQAHAELRRLILSGELPLGSSISEDALALRLGISRTPIREALRRLTEDGLVEAGDRQRARVANLEDDDIANIQDVRAALDALAAAACAKRRDPAVITDLRQRAAHIDDLVSRGDLGAAFAADGDFHRVLGEASGNRELAAHLKRLDGRIQLVRLRSCLDLDSIRANTALHGRLLDAIAAGDAKRAAAIAGEHALGGKH